MLRLFISRDSGCFKLRRRAGLVDVYKRQILNNAQKQSEAMHDQALQQAQKELTTLSVQIAGRVLEREVKPEDHARMVEEFLSEVKS